MLDLNMLTFLFDEWKHTYLCILCILSCNQFHIVQVVWPQLCTQWKSVCPSSQGASWPDSWGINSFAGYSFPRLWGPKLKHFGANLNVNSLKLYSGDRCVFLAQPKFPPWILHSQCIETNILLIFPSYCLSASVFLRLGFFCLFLRFFCQKTNQIIYRVVVPSSGCRL